MNRDRRKILSVTHIALRENRGRKSRHNERLAIDSAKNELKCVCV